MGAYWLFTPIDPEAPENRRAINIAFVTQSAPDIRKKLQKLEGFEGKVLSQLVEIAQRVFNNHDNPDLTQTKKVAKILVAAMNEGNKPERNARNSNQKKGQNNNRGKGLT